MSCSSGLVTGDSDALSVIQTASLTFGIYLFLVARSGVRILYQLFYIASFFVLLISSFLLLELGQLYWYLGAGLITLKSFISFVSKQEFSRYSVFKYVLMIVAVANFVLAGYLYVIDSEYSRFSKRVFKLYDNYAESSDVCTLSTETLQAMYFVPSDEVHLTLRDGNFWRDYRLPFIASDVDYVRTAYSAGLLEVFFIFFTPVSGSFLR